MASIDQIDLTLLNKMENYAAGYPPQLYPDTTQVVNPGYHGRGRHQAIQINRKAARGLGITQMTIGIICFILNIVLLGLNGGLFFPSYVGYGIWGGILFIVAGLLQVLSANITENKGLVIGTMVMSIISACDCAVVLALGIIEAYNGAVIRKQFYSYSSDYLYTLGTVQLAFGIIMAILAVVEASVAIATSALCCRSVCCKSSANSNQAQVVRNVVYHASNPGASC